MNTILEQLRSLPHWVQSASQMSYTYPFSLLEGGIPRSGLVQMKGTLGSGKTEATLQFLKENPHLKVAWIEKDFNFYPSVFSAYGIRPSRILFLDVGIKNPVTYALQILKSQVFQVIVLSQLDCQELELRRLQILAKQSNSLVILLNSTSLVGKNWSISLQMEVFRPKNSPSPRLKITRSKNLSLWPVQDESLAY